MGFEVNRFKSRQEISQELICNLCQHVLDWPLQRLDCKHLYCSCCIKKWLTSSPEKVCPVDGQPFAPNLEDLGKGSKGLHAVLSTLEIKCSFSSFGCKLFLPLNQLESHHRDGCLYNPDILVDCELNCGAVMRRRERRLHTCFSYLMGRKCRVSRKDSTDLLREALQGLRKSPRLRYASAQHIKLVDKLHAEGVIKSDKVYEAMLRVDLANFLSDEEDDPYDVGLATVGATLIEKYSVYLKEGGKALVISSYALSSYIATCFALIVGLKGYIVNMVGDETEVTKVKKGHEYLMDEGRLTLIVDTKEGVERKRRRNGYPEKAPYDVIIIRDDSLYLHDDKERANLHVLEKQLKPGGILLGIKV